MAIPIPNYSGACISNVVPAIALSLAKNRDGKDWPSSDMLADRITSGGSVIDLDNLDWVPKVVSEASQTVLFVVDGLGFSQLLRHLGELPNLSRLVGTSISSVAPTTTATALTSIASGLTPINHGLVGYRMRLGAKQVFNCLQWRCNDSATNRNAIPSKIAHNNPFFGLNVSVISKSTYAGTGFTRAYLGEGEAQGFRFPSTMVAKVRQALDSGDPFVYCYYEGVDSVAHEYGFSEFYLEELKFLDYLVGTLIEILPIGASLVLTADHGQVEVLDEPIVIDPQLEKRTVFKSGEGRFRWLHLHADARNDALKIAEEMYGEIAWILSREEALDSGLFGPDWASFKSNAKRFGDLALISKTDVAFYDATDGGPMKLICRHGSLTDEEAIVPLIGILGS